MQLWQHYGHRIVQSGHAACPVTWCATGHDMWHVQLRLDMAMSSCCSSALDIANGQVDMQLDFCYSTKLATNTAHNMLYNASDMSSKP
jgi:hypothetical protein